jgi:hypothetical protein
VNKPIDGGPAFPGHMVRVAGEMERAYEGGMSLRAHYAGQYGTSLAAVLVSLPTPGPANRS